MGIEQPGWAGELDWNDSKNLGRMREVLQSIIRKREKPIHEIEEAIKKSGVLTKRIKELESSQPRTENDDSGLKIPRVHPLESWDKAVGFLDKRVRHAAATTQNRDTSLHDLAVTHLHKLIKARHEAYPEAPSPTLMVQRPPLAPRLPEEK